MPSLQLEDRVRAGQAREVLDRSGPSSAVDDLRAVRGDAVPADDRVVPADDRVVPVDDKADQAADQAARPLLK